MSARPYNGSISLALTLLMPLSNIFGGATFVALSLRMSRLIFIKQISIALLGLSLIGLVINISIDELLISALMTWLPALLLVILIKKTRSLIFSVQLLAVFSVLFLLLFFWLIEQPVLFWNEILMNVSDVLNQGGLVEQARLLTESITNIAQQMTIVVIAMTWSIYSVILILGCAIYRKSINDENIFGNFTDLNFGRFLAIMTAISSLFLFIFDVDWLNNLAYLCFSFFWLQGLSFLHWLHQKRIIPSMGLILTYVMLPFFNILLIMLLAIVGYTDAWFNYRNRIKN
ncbi:MAG: hypothetical protein P8O19_04840 [Woeseiaceae bacterium]|nr:hypothetical protein [Woeseiaceae bacterium]MDG1866078.1 hypothetical protein [Woeseiaceae bacterium]